MDVYTALRNLVPEPGQAIPCHDASNLDLPPTTPSRPNQPARPMMVLVLVVLVVPAPPLVQTGCSAGWEEMSPGPARRPADYGHHTRGSENSGAAALARSGRPKTTITDYSIYFGAAVWPRGAARTSTVPTAAPPPARGHWLDRTCWSDRVGGAAHQFLIVCSSAQETFSDLRGAG